MNSNFATIEFNEEASQVIIRVATIDDAPSIAAVHKRSIEGGLNSLLPAKYVFGRSLKQFEDKWQENFQSTAQRFVLVAMLEDVLAGFIAIGLSPDADLADTGVLEVARFYVLPAHGRQGIGRRLMNEAVGRLPASPGAALMLWVFADNQPARAFYENYGFRLDGATKSDFGVELRRYRLDLSRFESASTI